MRRLVQLHGCAQRTSRARTSRKAGAGTFLHRIYTLRSTGFYFQSKCSLSRAFCICACICRKSDSVNTTPTLSQKVASSPNYSATLPLGHRQGTRRRCSASQPSFRLPFRSLTQLSPAPNYYVALHEHELFTSIIILELQECCTGRAI